MQQDNRQLVWIGAGKAKTPNVQFDDYVRVTLIEANERSYDDLVRANTQANNVVVKNAYIAPASGESVFTIYNIPDFSSVKSPTGIKAFYPGLKTIETANRRHLTLRELIDSLDLQGESNSIVIDTIDNADSLLTELIGSGAVKCFSAIYLTYSTEELFEGMTAAKDLIKLAEKNYFEASIFEDSDPDIVTYLFKVNRLKLSHSKEKERLAAEIQKLKRQLTADEAKYSERKDALNSQLERSEKQLGALKDANDTLKNELKTTEAKHKSEVNALNKELRKVKRLKLEDGNSLESFIHQCLVFFYGKAITYVDVGAFDGSVATAFFKSELRIKEAILLEPNPKSYAKLEENLEGCERLPKKLDVQNIAVSTSEGPLQLYDNNSMSRVVDGGQTDVFDSVVEVSTTSLSKMVELCSERHISLLKVDVEGHEMEVLNSGKALFENQQVDVVYIEAGLSPDGIQQVHYRLIDEFFTQHNYRLFRVFEQQFEWIEDSPHLRRWNMAYMSQDFANKHPYKVMKELFELKRKQSEG